MLEPLAPETGGRVIVSDLSLPDAPERLLAEAGEIDVLVANAGLPGSGRLNSFSAEEIDRALAVNLRAPMLLAHGLTESMVAARQRAPALHVLARGPRRRARHLGLLGDEVRPARLRAWACARTSRRRASASP